MNIDAGRMNSYADCGNTAHAMANGPPAAEWSAWFAAQRGRVNQAVADHLASLRPSDAGQTRLLAAVEYSLRQGGKRFRPILTLEVAGVCGGTWERAWPAALAAECVHTFSLIHDDLPAMDNDDLRRGQPTNHKVFGESTALLAGDWLLAHAFALLAGTGAPAAALTASLAAGTLGMIAGQSADIEGEGQPADAERVRFIHAHKTARLIEASCRMGAIIAGADEPALAAAARYGLHLGLAFQIADDLLDETGTTLEVGKRVAKDAAVKKQTYPAVYGIEESYRQAENEVCAALAALAPWGLRADNLRGLARHGIARRQ